MDRTSTLLQAHARRRTGFGTPALRSSAVAPVLASLVVNTALMTHRGIMRHMPSIAIVLTIMTEGAYAQSHGASREVARPDREACSRLEPRLGDPPALGASLDIAMCYQRAGKLARAWALYRESVDLAGEAGDIERRERAQDSAAALEPHLARITIVAPAELPAGFVVRWDGHPIEPDTLGIGLYADAGRHEVIASAPGFRLVKRIAMLVEGRSRRIAIPALAVALNAGDEAAPPPADDAPSDLVVAPPAPGAPSASFRAPLVLGLGGAGLAAAGGVVVYLARARSSLREARELCGSSLVCSNGVDYQRGQQLIRDARSSATTALALAVASGAAVVADAIVWLTRPGARRQTTATLVPAIHERGAGLTLIQRF